METKIYTVRLVGGNQGMVKADSVKSAWDKALHLFGSLNVSSVISATDEEIDWHKAMNGIFY